MSILDHEKQIFEYETTLKQLKAQNKDSDLWSDEEIKSLEEKLEVLKSKVYSDLSPQERIDISRHPSRPKTLAYIKALAEDFTEIHGDRLYRDDHAVITGFGTIGSEKFMIIGQEKGNDTESRLYRNFGMPHPEGYRKALRAMKLAERFNIPVLAFLDTPGAFPGLEAEERGQGWAIAENLLEMSNLKTPIIAALIGEGCSGGALGIGVADVVVMLEHAYYSVITPEGCASILWKDSQKKGLAASALKLLAEDLIKLDIIDDIIKEPQGGAHHDPDSVFTSLKTYILKTTKKLKKQTSAQLLDNRYAKYRKMGKYLEVETVDA